jgi:hypothetical protein
MLGGIAGKEAYNVHTTNIIPQWQYFVYNRLSFHEGDVFGLRIT